MRSSSPYSSPQSTSVSGTLLICDLLTRVHAIPQSLTDTGHRTPGGVTRQKAGPTTANRKCSVIQSCFLTERF